MVGLLFTKMFYFSSSFVDQSTQEYSLQLLRIEDHWNPRWDLSSRIHIQIALVLHFVDKESHWMLDILKEYWSNWINN